MKKEIKVYFKNAVQARGFVIDVINMFLGIAIIVIAVIALSGGENEIYLFPVIFVLGTVLACLNAVKMLKQQNRLLGIFFAIFTVVLLAAGVLSVLALLSV